MFETQGAARTRQLVGLIGYAFRVLDVRNPTVNKQRYINGGKAHLLFRYKRKITIQIKNNRPMDEILWGLGGGGGVHRDARHGT